MQCKHYCNVSWSGRLSVLRTWLQWRWSEAEELHLKLPVQFMHGHTKRHFPNWACEHTHTHVRTRTRTQTHRWFYRDLVALRYFLFLCLKVIFIILNGMPPLGHTNTLTHTHTLPYEPRTKGLHGFKGTWLHVLFLFVSSLLKNLKGRWLRAPSERKQRAEALSRKWLWE